jgi:hypothetical protein
MFLDHFLCGDGDGKVEEIVVSSWSEKEKLLEVLI